MSFEFKNLEKVNSEIKTTDIKNKAYAEVNQRILAFRKLVPSGTILTEMLSNENGVCVFKATATDENGEPLATGHAYEREDSSFINKTSYIENCETSAVGRALGMLGIGIDTSVASYEEVATAIKNQTAQKSDDRKAPVTSEQIGKIKLEMLRTGVTEEKLCAAYEVDSINNLSSSQAEKCIARLKKSKSKDDSDN